MQNVVSMHVGVMETALQDLQQSRKTIQAIHHRLLHCERTQALTLCCIRALRYTQCPLLGQVPKELIADIAKQVWADWRSRMFPVDACQELEEAGKKLADSTVKLLNAVHTIEWIFTDMLCVSDGWLKATLAPIEMCACAVSNEVVLRMLRESIAQAQENENFASLRLADFKRLLATLN